MQGHGFHISHSTTSTVRCHHFTLWRSRVLVVLHSCGLGGLHSRDLLVLYSHKKIVLYSTGILREPRTRITRIYHDRDVGCAVRLQVSDGLGGPGTDIVFS